MTSNLSIWRLSKNDMRTNYLRTSWHLKFRKLLKLWKTKSSIWNPLTYIHTYIASFCDCFLLTSTWQTWVTLVKSNLDPSRNGIRSAASSQTSSAVFCTPARPSLLSSLPKRAEHFMKSLLNFDTYTEISQELLFLTVGSARGPKARF